MARTKLGNTAVSSLLKSAQASYNRTQAYNDQMAGYEYDLSAKTAEDFNKYKAYLSDRATKEQDPSKQLSLQKTLTSADRTYRSAEIFRASESVNYGDISNTDKYQKMLGLYQDAVSNGDYNQAQSIEGQLASLSITIQNQRDAAASAAAAGSGRGRGGSGSGVSAGTALSDQVRSFDTLKQAFQNARDGGHPVKNSDGSIAIDPTTNKPFGYITPNNYQALAGTLAVQQEQAIKQAAEATGDPYGIYADKLQKLYNSTEYQSYNSDQSKLLQQNGDLGMGRQLQKDGTWKYTQLGSSGVAPAVDKAGNPLKDSQGNPLFTHTYDTGKTSDKKYITNEALDNSPGAPMYSTIESLNPGLPTEGIKAGQKRQGLDYYASSKTGAIMNQFGQSHGLAPEELKKIETAGKKGGPTGAFDYQHNGGEVPNIGRDELHQILYAPEQNIANTVHVVGDAIKGIVPTAQQAIQSLSPQGAAPNAHNALAFTKALQAWAPEAANTVNELASNTVKTVAGGVGKGAAAAVNGAVGAEKRISGAVGGTALNALQGIAGIGNMQKAIKEAQAKAEAARQAQAAEQSRQIQLAYQRQQSIATASRAATPPPRIYNPVPAYNPYAPVSSTNKVYLPAPTSSPAQVFSGALAAGKSTAAAIGNAVGYRF